MRSLAVLFCACDTEAECLIRFCVVRRQALGHRFPDKQNLSIHSITLHVFKFVPRCLGCGPGFAALPSSKRNSYILPRHSMPTCASLRCLPTCGRPPPPTRLMTITLCPRDHFSLISPHSSQNLTLCLRFLPELRVPSPSLVLGTSLTTVANSRLSYTFRTMAPASPSLPLLSFTRIIRTIPKPYLE